MRKKYNNRVKNAKKRMKQSNYFNNKNCCNKIIRLFLQIANEINNNSKNNKNYCNYKKRKYINKNYFEFKQNNFQVNIIKSFR